MKGHKGKMAVGKVFPSRSRQIEVAGPYPKGPASRSAVSEGKKPKKGVLLKGGGHG